MIDDLILVSNTISVSLVAPKSLLLNSILPVKINTLIGMKMRYNTPKAIPNLKLNPCRKILYVKNQSIITNSRMNNMVIK